MISTYDDWIHERIEERSFWIVHLSNGEILYQDDERYEEPAILRLKEYVESNNLSIIKIFIRFRSHWELAYEGISDGIYFRRSIKGGIFSEKNEHSLIIGHVQGNKAYCKKWIVPEIICCEEETRIISKNEEGVIWNSKTS